MQPSVTGESRGQITGVWTQPVLQLRVIVSQVERWHNRTLSSSWLLSSAAACSERGGAVHALQRWSNVRAEKPGALSQPIDKGGAVTVRVRFRVQRAASAKLEKRVE